MSEVSVRTILTGQTNRSLTSPVKETPANDDIEYKAFSFGRVGNRTLSMVTFKTSDGAIEAFCYADLRRISSSEPSRQLILRFIDQIVVVSGQNLEPLLRYIKAWRCDEIVESRRITESLADATYIDDIKFKLLEKRIPLA